MPDHAGRRPPPEGRGAVERLLTEERFAEAAAAARGLVLARPRSISPRRQLAEALVALGDVPALRGVLADIRARFDGRDAGMVLERCILRLTARRRYDDAVGLLDDHATGTPSADLLALLLPLGAQGRHKPDFLRRVGALDDAAAAALRSQVASEEHDPRRAEALLAEVPKGHPLHRPTLHRAFKAAQRLHDLPAIGRIGARIARLGPGDGDLEVLHHTLRAAAGQGRMEVAARVFGQMEALMAGIREDEDRFRKRWRTVAHYAHVLYDIPGGEADLARAERMGLLGSGDSLGAEQARRFLDRHGAVVAAARANLTALLTGGAPTFPENELVRVQSLTTKFLTIGKSHFLGPMLCWLAVVGEVIEQAEAAGGAATLLPDWLGPAAAAHGRPALVLSYHTVGRSPGVVHFKEADLPTYVSMDPDGYAGWSRLARRTIADLPLATYPERKVAAWFEAARRDILTARVSKYAQPDGADAGPLPEDYVFVPLQVATDQVQALARVPMMDMLGLVVRRFAGTGTRVVVKRHPLCRDMGVALALDEFAGRGAIILSESNIHDLIAGSRAVITVNSGVGSEALLHLKPVYLFGEADYAAATHAVTGEEDFLTKTSPIRLPFPPETLKAFLYYFRRVALVDVSDNERLAAAVEGRIIGRALKRRATAEFSG